MPVPPLQIFYPNGGTSAAQMYIWDSIASEPVLWDGVVTASVTVGAISGNRTSNTAVPGATNIGVLAGIATVAAPSYTEGFLVGLSTDLSGALRVLATIDTTGLATSAKQDTGNTSLASIDGKITAVNTGAVVISSGTITAVTSITNALPSGTNVIGHIIADTGSTTAVTGNVTVIQPTGTNLHTVIDSGTITTVSAVTAITNALPAGTNAIGKLAANSGVDIGDVDVTSIAAGTNTIGAVNVKPATAGGLLIAQMTSADGSTALTNSAQAIKASAGQLFGWYIYNPNASATYVPIYNTAAASVTVGTTNPVMTLCIPATSAANVEFTNGIEFTNAGWSVAATTTGGGNGAPGAVLEANFFYK